MAHLVLLTSILLFAGINGENVLTASTTLSSTTSSTCTPQITAKFDQPSSNTASLRVTLTLSELSQTCGDTTGDGRFSINIFQYAEKTYASSSTNAGDSDKFGNLIASIWTDASNSLSKTINLNGVSLSLGEDTSILGRAAVLQYCTSTSASSCTTVLASGVVARRTPDNSIDINVAGPTAIDNDGSSALICSLSGNGISGNMHVHNELGAASLRLTATGTSLLPGNVHQLSIQRMDGNVLGIEKPTTHHNFPCSTHRRLGDLGNVVVRATASTTSGSEATYAARFGLFDDQLHTLVGNKCVLWSNADVTCDIYKNGCGTESDNRVILASGIIGLTNGDGGGNEGKEYDYDCTSKIVRSVSARIYPVSSSSSIYGTAEIIETLHASTKTTSTTIDVFLTGTPGGTSNALSIQMTGDIGSTGDISNVFAPLTTSIPEMPPIQNRRVGDLGNVQAEISYGGTFDGTNTHGISLTDATRSIVGRAIAIHAKPFDFSASTTSNPIVAWGVLGITYTAKGNTNVASSGRTENIQNGAESSGDTVVCVLRAVGNNKVSGNLRFTSVSTKSTNSTTTTLPGILIQGSFTFGSSSSYSLKNTHSSHSLEIHEYGDLVTENVGNQRGATPSNSKDRCPPSTSNMRLGFLGDVTRNTDNQKNTEFVALLHTSTTDDTTGSSSSSASSSSSLQSLVGRACVLKSGPHGDTTRTQVAIGVIAIAKTSTSAIKNTISSEILKFEKEASIQMNATSSSAPIVDVNRLDCIHRKTDEYNRAGTILPGEGKDASVKTGLTSGEIALIVCLTIGSLGCCIGLIGFWYIRNKKIARHELLEEARLIRNAVPSVAIDPLVDNACPPPPEAVLHEAAAHRRRISAQVTGKPEEQLPPGHRRVASRFNPNRRPVSVQMSAMNAMNTRKDLILNKTKKSETKNNYSNNEPKKNPTPKHVRSKTISQFRQNKQFAQENVRNLVAANMNYKEGVTMTELRNSTTGRPMSVRVGAPKEHTKKRDTGKLPVHPKVMWSQSMDLRKLQSGGKMDFLTTSEVGNLERDSGKSSTNVRLLL